MAALAGPALAQQGGAPPQTPPATSDSPQTTTVVVQGQRNEVSDRIDRRVYDIKDDPDSQSGTAGDVLDKLPSVTVNPAGRVTLRGDANVTVLIDGKYPINGNNFTQTLAASDIDRIEVITNPSAQYQTDGTGGIINIITKKHHPFGLSGTATVRGSSLGQITGNASLSLTQGPWSITGRINAGEFPGKSKNSSVETVPETILSGQENHYFNTGAGMEVEVARKLGDDQTLTVNQSLYPNWAHFPETAYYLSPERDFTTAQTQNSHGFYDRTEFIYDRNNEASGQHFTFDAEAGQWNNHSRMLTTDSYTSPTTGQAIYGTRTRETGPDDDVKADYEAHPASGNILSTGFEWKRIGDDEIDDYSDMGDIAGPHPDGSERHFAGTRDITALYVTYQHPLFGGWTMLPGLRAEYEALDILSEGMRARPDDLRFYPTLHLSHALGKGKLKLSYSRRVDRPSLSEYDPARVYTSAVSATQGNPGLKAPTTDSFELGYEYSQGKVSTDATVYYHALSDAVSDYYQDLGNGVMLDQPINSGRNQSAGSEFTVKRPVSKHWKVSFNLNLFYSEVPLITAAGGQEARGAVSYVSNSSLEYDWDKGDQVQLDLGLTGRQLQAQGYLDPVSHLDLTWRHNLTKKLALVVNAQDMLGGMRWVSITTSPDLKSRWVQPPTDRLIRISLTRTFGGPPGK
jgi:ferric enterobactin receptor